MCYSLPTCLPTFYQARRDAEAAAAAGKGAGSGTGTGDGSGPRTRAMRGNNDVYMKVRS